MRASVLVHNRNRGSVLKRCLDSLLVQDYRPLELVVLDAGSTDGSVAIIEVAQEKARMRGIDFVFVECEMAGVARSRNMAAAATSGDILIFLDNDETVEHPSVISVAMKRLESTRTVALVTGRVLLADSAEEDPACWVHRRPKTPWASREFRTFTFLGGLSAVRKTVFEGAGGFWEQLEYSREEEDLSLKLIDMRWDIIYDPAFVCRHYPDQRGRMNLSQRRRLELTNGLLVLYRRLPLAAAYAAMLARVLSMTIKGATRGTGVRPLWAGVLDARRIWVSNSLKRDAISWRGLVRYAGLHRRKDL